MCAKFPDLGVTGCADTGPAQSTLRDKSDESSEVFVHGKNHAQEYSMATEIFDFNLSPFNGNGWLQVFSSIQQSSTPLISALNQNEFYVFNFF